MIQIKNYTAGENQMIGFIKYINYKDGYGYISIPDRAKKDIVFRIPAGEVLKKDDTVKFDVFHSVNGKAYAGNIVKQERNTSIYNTEDKQEWVKSVLPPSVIVGKQTALCVGGSRGYLAQAE